MVDSARFRFVNKKLTNGVRSAAANGDGPPNQCKGSDENRGHALHRVWNTSLSDGLSLPNPFSFWQTCQVRRFLVLGTLPRGTAIRFTRYATLRDCELAGERNSCGPQQVSR